MVDDVMKTLRYIVAILILIVPVLMILFAAEQRKAGKANANKFVCIQNLRNLAVAKLSWAEQHGKTTNDVPVMGDLTNFTHVLLRCPAGGTYTLGKVGEDPKCSIKGHAIP
jgi:hypothetical protein